eukprot:1315903-Pleurochrysis_carterae.AAC.3
MAAATPPRVRGVRCVRWHITGQGLGTPRSHCCDEIKLAIYIHYSESGLFFLFLLFTPSPSSTPTPCFPHQYPTSSLSFSSASSRCGRMRLIDLAVRVLSIHALLIDLHVLTAQTRLSRLEHHFPPPPTPSDKLVSPST